jgi:hypothetical protein
MKGSQVAPGRFMIVFDRPKSSDMAGETPIESELRKVGAQIMPPQNGKARLSFVCEVPPGFPIGAVCRLVREGLDAERGTAMVARLQDGKVFVWPITESQESRKLPRWAAITFDAAVLAPAKQAPKVPVKPPAQKATPVKATPIKPPAPAKPAPVKAPEAAAAAAAKPAPVTKAPIIKPVAPVVAKPVVAKPVVAKPAAPPKAAAKPVAPPPKAVAKPPAPAKPKAAAAKPAAKPPLIKPAAKAKPAAKKPAPPVRAAAKKVSKPAVKAKKR